MRILYVEDNPANLFLIQRVARMGSHEVVNYTEGQIALDNFERDKPDLVLMDVQLPGKLNGLEVVKALRAAGHKTPIVAVTAYAMMGDRDRCLEAGCTAYVAKPMSIADLVEMLKHYDPAAARPAQLDTPAAAPLPAPAEAARVAENPLPSSNGPTVTVVTPPAAKKSTDETKTPEV